MRLAAYLRVSTDRQAEEGLGLDVQEQAITKWAKTNRHTIVSWHRDEGVSGSNGVDGRPGLLDALNAIESGEATGVVVHNLDRLARTLTVQESVLALVWSHGGSAHAVNLGEVQRDDPDDPYRTAMRQMAGVFAQLERAMIVKRMRDGRRRKRQLGGYAGDGPPPYGYACEDGQLVPVPSEQATLKAIRKLRKQGRTLRQIADCLNSDQVAPPRGDTWHPPTVSRILARSGR
jgi:DNA invertase Pin-like site-specific DNA recombinase